MSLPARTHPLTSRAWPRPPLTPLLRALDAWRPRASARTDKGADIWTQGTSGDALIRHPWRDVFGDGKWLRQAYKPGRHDVQLTDAQLSEKNLALAARLHADGAESLAKGLCSGRGLYTQVMPWWRRGSISLCHCLPGWYGKDCEYGPGDARAPIEKQYCVCVTRRRMHLTEHMRMPCARR